MKRDDILWKAILEDTFDDFLIFFYENANDIFDFSKGFEFLDKELDDLFPNQESENVRYVDKLVKVHLKTGAEKWILVHVEVQGYKDKAFEERMFTYYYRIKDRYQREITAWAILTDANKKYNPNTFTSQFLGTEITYKFNVYKILELDEVTLRQSDNIFATIVLTVLLNLKNKTSEEKKLIELTLDIIKNLYKKGFPKQKVRSVMNFIQYYVRFNPENSIIFEKEIDNIKGKTGTMGIEQFLLDRATKKGIEKGIEKGIDLGIEKAMKKTILNGYDNGLSIAMICNINELSEEYVMKVLKENGRLS